jgi:RNA polymerase sigma factor (sigma-70 family)
LDQAKKYTEEFLYSGLRSKSKQAFEYLYDNYSPALYGVVYNILHNEEASNDALQEVFVKIWNNFDSYDPERSRLYTWMMNIARNHAIDKLRSKAMKGDKELKNDKEFIRNASGSLSQFTDGIGLNKLVNELEKEQKDIIDLLYFKGFTQTEAAEELNIPLGTVKSRVRLAMNKLRKHFT